MNNKQKINCEKLFKQNNETDDSLNELFKRLPLFQKSEEGLVLMSHPWQTTFGHGAQHGVFEINGKVARHILTHFNNIESDDPSLVRRNRQKIVGSIKRYSKAMREGHWKVSAPLVFEEGTGALLDGQNRLEALAQVAEEFNPQDASHYSEKFSVCFGCDQSVQDFIDKGSSRTIAQTAKIKGLIGQKDSNGVDALKILQGVMHKAQEGNGFDTSLANENDIFDAWHSVEPNTGQTYEDICRYVSDTCSIHNSAYELQIGHKIVLAQAYISDSKKVGTFIDCVTADVDRLQDLKKDGIDITFSTNKFSSVRRARKYLSRLGNNKKLNGSNGGGAKTLHYGHMLYFVDQFINGRKTSNICHRILTSCPSNKYKNQYVSFGYAQPQEDLDIQALLSV